MSYSKEDVREKIEPEDIMTLLDYFNASPQMFTNYIVSYTICHGGNSKKLYYYFDTGLFHCYTDCSKSFDVFELVQKVKHLEDLNAAIYFVVEFLNLKTQLEEYDDSNYSGEDWKIFSRYEKSKDIEEKNNSKLVLDECDLSILKHYPQPRYLNWEKDNISKEICDYMNIHYDPVNGCIVIPHFDENGRCVGIRQRTLIKNQEQYGKYRPWYHNGKIYNHPLGFNLYGLNISKDHIKDMKIAIVFESEKSVLQYLSYFGISNSLCVAVCGSSLSNYQFNLLQESGAKEIVIGFDKDFQEIGSDDWKNTVNKLQKIYDKYSSYVNVSFLFDKENNQLGYKSSPTDEGRDKFLYLFRNRIIL